MALRLGKCRASPFEYRSSKERGFESHPVHQFLHFWTLLGQGHGCFRISLFVRLKTGGCKGFWAMRRPGHGLGNAYSNNVKHDFNILGSTYINSLLERYQASLPFLFTHLLATSAQRSSKM